MARVRVYRRCRRGDWVRHRRLGGRCLVVEVAGSLATVAWREVRRLSPTQVEVRDCEVDYPVADLEPCP